MDGQLQQLRFQEDTKLRRMLETQSRVKISQSTAEQIKKSLKEQIFILLWDPLWEQLIRLPETSIRNRIWYQLKQGI